MMLRYVIQRLVMIAPVAIGVTAIVFLMLQLVPGDPIRMMLGVDYSEEAAARLRHELNLDQPLPVQYILWLRSALTGDLGRSYYNQQSVTDLIAGRIGPTFLLSFGTMAVAVLVAIPFGMLSAIYRGTFIDSLSRVLSVLGISMPIFWFGLLLQIVFSLKLGWFPAGGSVSEYGPKALVLPSVALGAGFAALIARMTRSGMLEVLQQDYIRTARAKGLAAFSVYFRHALRNALIPIVTVAAMQFGVILGGAVLTEIVFNMPGLGRLLVEAINRRDYPVIQGSVLVVALGFVLVNLAADLSYTFLDPKIRYG